MSTAALSPSRSYESRLNADPEWALNEGSRHFDENSSVHQTLRKIASKLTELGIPYAVAGGMALFRHGFRRFTEDVDLLVSKQDLPRIHAELEGRGYLPAYVKSKNLRNTETGVRIEFLIAGQYPGDGKPKDVAFPDPSQASVEIEGISYLPLAKLIELKLASGMTNSDRIKDLGDVQELIKVLNLPHSFKDKLHQFVRGKYEELWTGSMGPPKRYVQFWRNKFHTVDAQSLAEMAQALRSAADQLQAMLDDGVVLDPSGGTADDYALLVTTDAEVARKYDMRDESEFFGLGDEEEVQ